MTKNLNNSKQTPYAQTEISQRIFEEKQVAVAPSTHVNDELLTTSEACEILKCGLTRLYQLMNSGQLKSVSMGKSRRIPRSAINEFIASLPSF